MYFHFEIIFSLARASKGKKTIFVEKPQEKTELERSLDEDIARCLGQEEPPVIVDHNADKRAGQVPGVTTGF